VSLGGGFPEDDLPAGDGLQFRGQAPDLAVGVLAAVEVVLAGFVVGFPGGQDR
jgi:hypothetical protein